MSSSASVGKGDLSHQQRHQQHAVITLQQSPEQTPRGWVDEGPALPLLAGSSPSSEEHLMSSFRILLRQNEAQLKAVFEAVSDPKSAKYGKHLSAEQLRELVSPPVEEQARVEAWLRKALAPLPNEAHDVQSMGDYVIVKHATVEAVQRAFGCEVHRFREQDPPSGVSIGSQQSNAPFQPRVVLRCVGAIQIPAKFEGLVTGTTGLIDMPMRVVGGPHPHPQPPNSRVPGDYHPPDSSSSSSSSSSQVGQSEGDDFRAPRVPPMAVRGSQMLPQRGENPIPVHQNIAHPHQTFRSVTQLNRIAAELDREQLLRKQQQQ